MGPKKICTAYSAQRGASVSPGDARWPAIIIARWASRAGTRFSSMVLQMRAATCGQRRADRAHLHGARMGMPTPRPTSSGTVAAPALIRRGFRPFLPTCVSFYYAILAAITRRWPALYAAASIADAPIMKTVSPPSNGADRLHHPVFFLNNQALLLLGHRADVLRAFITARTAFFWRWCSRTSPTAEAAAPCRADFLLRGLRLAARSRRSTDLVGIA
jgi:hypothetical protein